MWGALQDAGVDCFYSGQNRKVAQVLMHKLDSVGFGGAMVGEICYLGVDLGGQWGMTFTGAGS